MDKLKYKEFVKYNMEIGRTQKFGWYSQHPIYVLDDISEFEIFDISFNGDEIKIQCEYINGNSKNLVLLIYKKSEYTEYLKSKRNKKLKKIGF